MVSLGWLGMVSEMYLKNQKKNIYSFGKKRTFKIQLNAYVGGIYKNIE